jgi:hypothetical protein
MKGKVALAIGLFAFFACQNMALAAGSCAGGKITCSDWCGKYAGGSSQCLETDPKSCLNKFGSLSFCVNDKPRANTVSCTDWCNKCKPDAACFSSCSRTGNGNVDSSCSSQ